VRPVGVLGGGNGCAADKLMVPCPPLPDVSECAGVLGSTEEDDEEDGYKSEGGRQFAGPSSDREGLAREKDS
jgi:hypothetical protein